jgi:hypothetical protein
MKLLNELRKKVEEDVRKSQGKIHAYPTKDTTPGNHEEQDHSQAESQNEERNQMDRSILEY